jgi:hypothetical protein
MRYNVLKRKAAAVSSKNKTSSGISLHPQQGREIFETYLVTTDA